MNIIENAIEAATEATSTKAVKSQVGDIIEQVQRANGTRKEMLKRMQSEVGITYANAYYYVSRVFNV